MSAQMVARVTLKKCRTYVTDGIRWIKDVPRVITGENEIKKYQLNGHFYVDVLRKASKPEAKPTPKPEVLDDEIDDLDEDLDEDEDDTEEVVDSKKSKKSSSKKPVLRKRK